MSAMIASDEWDALSQIRHASHAVHLVLRLRTAGHKWPLLTKSTINVKREGGAKSCRCNGELNVMRVKMAYKASREGHSSSMGWVVCQPPERRPSEVA